MSIWWYSLWGNWRCKWLHDKQKESFLLKENIDPILCQVFSTITFDSSMTEEHYSYLIEILDNRHYHATQKEVFNIHDICNLCMTIPEENKRAWKIIFKMILLKKNMNCVNKLFEQTILKVKSIIESNINDKEEKYFLYLIAIHDLLYHQYNTSSSYSAKIPIKFSPENESIVTDVRKNVWNLYSF